MKKEKRVSGIILATAVIQFSIVPIQLNAFRAPDTQKSIQNFGAKEKDSSQSIQLKNVSKHNLQEKITGNTTFTVQNLAQNIFNNGITHALSSVSSTQKNTQANTLSFASVRKTQTDKLGFQHIRVAQEYKNLPVVGAEIVIHVNKNENIYMINGKYQPDLDIDTNPSITQNEALSIGTKEQRTKENMHISQKPSLVIYNAQLAWFYVIEYNGREPGQWYYYINAKNGKKLNSFNNIKYAAPVQGSGTAEAITGNRLSGEDGTNVSIQGFSESSGSNNYFLYSFVNIWGVYDTDANDWEQQVTSTWGSNDTAAVSCAHNFEDTQNYVSTILNRNSFDNNGAFARADIHVDTNLVNAYWDGTKFNFGDGDGSASNALTVLDVSAHEYGHAITQYTSNLTYQDESGALNEAYSDILGTAVEFQTQTDGRGTYPNGSDGKSDWLMGEDCWLSSEALRDMRDPQRFGQPSYYHGTNWYTGSNDHGGVHTNSGVANFAFYLLAEGGSASNDGHDYTITGIGIAEAAAVALRANYIYHTSSSTYTDARTDWIQAATDLGYNAQTVADVWTACGVLPPPPTYTILDVADEWTAASPDARHKSGSYAGYHSFTLTKTTPITIDLESSVDTYMFLLNTSDTIIEENDDGGNGLNSRIKRTLDAGTYTVEATTYGADTTGTFTVKIIGEGTDPRKTLAPVIMYLLN